MKLENTHIPIMLGYFEYKKSAIQQSQIYNFIAPLYKNALFLWTYCKTQNNDRYPG